MEVSEHLVTDRFLISELIAACHATISAHAEHLSALDRAIGDGDHGTNMCRGFDAVMASREQLSTLPLPAALEQAGMALVMNIGGAAGPLYGTLLIKLGRGLSRNDIGLAEAFGKAVDAVARRGRSGPGDKTLLDVLYPVHAEVVEGAALNEIASRAASAAQATQFVAARRGRASWLGARSIGHVDPGAASAALLISAICHFLMEHHRP